MSDDDIEPTFTDEQPLAYIEGKLDQIDALHSHAIDLVARAESSPSYGPSDEMLKQVLLSIATSLIEMNERTQVREMRPSST